MGSANSKARKKKHPLPKVGTPANEAYELRTKRAETSTFGMGAVVAIVVALVAVLVFVLISAL